MPVMENLKVCCFGKIQCTQRFPTIKRKKALEKREKSKGKRKRKKKDNKRPFFLNQNCNFDALFVQSSKNVDFVRASRTDWSIQFHFMFN